ncbi:MAG: hypothetical protein ABUL72_03580 [Armatimonadota bacterium]
MKQRTKRRKNLGMTMLLAAALLALVIIGVTSYLDHATSSIRLARNSNHEARANALAESAFYDCLQGTWSKFKVAQTLTSLDTALNGASVSSPRATVLGTVTDDGSYSAGVIGIETPTGDPASRVITIRALGWVDSNENGALDSGEPVKTLDYKVQLSLKRSNVFDYAHFVNNYGWIKGFDASSMIVNGDWRVNGDWQIVDGQATVNGSVIAAINNKLDPPAVGQVMSKPVKWDQSTYASKAAGNGRMRPAYNSSSIGDFNSAAFGKYRDLLFQSEAEIVNGEPFGATLQDSNGIEAWRNEWNISSHAILDTKPTSEIPMPDLDDFGKSSDPADAGGKQFAKSKAWVDTLATYQDGTANPNYAGAAGSAQEMNGTQPNPNYKGAYVDAWDTTSNSYKRVSTGGVVSNSALLVGTQDHPIRIHGPVTVDGDVALAGYVQGQGTLYSSRNVQIVGSIKYSSPPDFRGDIATSDLRNEKKSALGLAARGSVILGDPDLIDKTLLSHMMPPFTKNRTDDAGNVIPAFDATQVDSYGIAKYQSLLEQNPATAAAFKAAASGDVAQIDAFVYTNNVFAGTAGWGYKGLTINGAVVCKDEAVAAYSTPVTINYDSRIRDRGDNNPLIDIHLPRGPVVKILGYQDRGFSAIY